MELLIVFIIGFVVVYVIGTSMQTRRCPYCRKQVSNKASICPNCQKDLV